MSFLLQDNKSGLNIALAFWFTFLVIPTQLFTTMEFLRVSVIVTFPFEVIGITLSPDMVEQGVSLKPACK